MLQLLQRGKSFMRSYWSVCTKQRFYYYYDLILASLNHGKVDKKQEKRTSLCLYVLQFEMRCSPETQKKVKFV